MSDTDSIYEQEVEANREIWLERVNINLEKLLAKANRDKDMLRHMKHHCWARMHVGKAKNEDFEKDVEQSTKTVKEARPTSSFGWGFIGWAWYIMEGLFSE